MTSKSTCFVLCAVFALLAPSNMVHAKRMQGIEGAAKSKGFSVDADSSVDADANADGNLGATLWFGKKKQNKKEYDGKNYAPVDTMKWDKDGLPLALEDSNVAKMDSDEAKRVRHEAAQTEPAWQDVGTEVGVWVWRIEQFKVVAWPKDKYGQFHTGDSYIVLQVVKKDEASEALERNIFFWLGAESSLDEKGTAAYKTVELDDFFNGEPTQHREVMNHESKEFRELFERIEYLEGGVTTGFNPLSPVEYRKTLIVVRKLDKEEKCPKGGEDEKSNQARYCLMDLPWSAKSLNKGDCFLIVGKDLSYWCGRYASPHEKVAAAQMALEGQRSRPHHSDTQVNLIEDDAEFAKLLGGKRKHIKNAVKSLTALPTPVFGEGILFELSDDGKGDLYVGQMKLTLTEKARGELTKSMLNSDNVMMLDTDSEIFIWVGRGASDIERRNGLRTAMTYLDNNGKSPDTSIHVLKDQDTPISNAQWNKIFAD